MSNYGFLDYLKNTKKVSMQTAKYYISDVENFENYLVREGVNSLIDATSENLKQYLQVMALAGKKESTIMRALSSIKCYYNYLIFMQVIDTNICDTIKHTSPEEKLPKILSAKEVDRLLSIPNIQDEKGCRDKAMLELLYATGARVSELIDFNIDDISLSFGYITCRKKGCERNIPIYPAVAQAIDRYIKYSRNIILKGNLERALFVNMNGSRMTRQGFWKIIKYYKEKANISHELTPHTLRHSFAVHLMQNGANLQTVKELLGHADVSSTQIYSKIIKSKLCEDYLKYHPRACNMA